MVDYVTILTDAMKIKTYWYAPIYKACNKISRLSRVKCKNYMLVGLV